MNSIEFSIELRKAAVTMVHRSHAAHIASALSIADILSVLYLDIMHVDPQTPDWKDRDRLILSKGHAGVAIYAALALRGFFPLEDLSAYYTDGSPYSGHVSHKGVPGVEFSTGSLGHGACAAAGMALAGKKAASHHRVYTIVGDGECDEGSIWEMALFARQQHLDNLTVIVDHNHMQAMGRCADVLDLGDLAGKWRAFGWNVIEVADGNDHDQLREALRAEHPRDVPTCIVAHTVKGKGVSFMENELLWHYRDPQGEFYARAMAELEAAYHA